MLTEQALCMNYSYYVDSFLRLPGEYIPKTLKSISKMETEQCYLDMPFLQTRTSNYLFVRLSS